MKLKEIFYGIGLKPPVKEYSFDIDTFVLPREGTVSYARWQHPKERKKVISQETIDALRAFLKPGEAAIDIGAHTGDTAVPLGLALGPAGAVFALEPNLHVYKVLLANAALNRKKTNIFPLMFAATPQDGEFEFEYSDAGFCNGGLHEGINPWRHGHFFKLRVMGKNLLNFLKTEFPAELAKVRYIKIDTEGFDRTVARSLKELLVSNRPFIRSEIYQHSPPEERRGYYRDLRELGYIIHKFESDREYAGPVLSEDDLLKWEHFDVFAVPDGSPFPPPRGRGPG